jgi:thioredoxin-related protein
MRNKLIFILAFICQTHLFFAQEVKNIERSEIPSSIGTERPPLSEKGIKFIHEDFEKALAQAKFENKILFMDAYTTWCGPCKLMTKNTFPDTTVAALFNKNFVNLKLDMEKGMGSALLTRYGITAFPTLLFVDGEGEIVHKALGYLDVEQFIELGNTVLAGNQTLSSWTKKYDAGDRTPTFLKDYTLKLAEAYDKRKGQIAEEYLATQTDWLTDENLEFLYKNTEGVDGKLFPFLVKNKKAFEKITNAAEVDAKIQGMVADKIFNEKDLPTLTYADSLIQLVYDKQADKMSKKYRIDYARMKGDRAGFADASVQYLKKYNKDANELNEIAMTFFEQIDDKKMLKKAISWSKKAIKLDKSSGANYLTLANLYQKINKKSNAIKAAETAIYVGKTNGEETSEAEKLLQLLKDGEKAENKK